jgi:hypothetical protein
MQGPYLSQFRRLSSIIRQDILKTLAESPLKDDTSIGW